jgi:hypothetical protein
MSLPSRPVFARRLVLLLALVSALLVVAAPATANSKPTTGSRIGLYVPPATFAADTPFYVKHGFACGLTEVGCIATPINGTSSFSLYVDGVLQRSSVEVEVGGGAISKRYLTNIPNGLPAGVHTLTGVWNLNGSVTQTLTATITFS